MFIAFEGIDGSGKSTQFKLFSEYLFDKDKHNNLVLTRNPYKDTNIREILRESNDPLTQADKLATLFIEDRFKQAKEIINPNLEEGNIVITDRHKLSTITYQGAQGLAMQDLLKRHEGLPVPDITFIIDVPSKDAAFRMQKDNKRDIGREHKFEADSEFQETIRQNYLKAKQLSPNDKIFIIDGNRNQEIIHKEVVEIFEREISDLIEDKPTQLTLQFLLDEIKNLKQKIEDLEKTPNSNDPYSHTN